MTPSDQVLIARYKAGDVRAFHTLVDRYTAPLYNLTLRLLRDSMEAENVTQEAFLRVIATIDRVRLDTPFKPYLFQIAVNLCRDLARKKHPLLFTDLDSRSSRAHGSETDYGSEAIADEAPPLWEHLEKAELALQLHRAIDRLPPAYQAVIILRYMEDLTYEEIAQVLGTPLNTIRTQLRRAKHQLRTYLEEELHSVPPPDGPVRLTHEQGGS